MRRSRKSRRSLLVYLLVLCMVATVVQLPASSISAKTAKATLTYQFTGDDSATPGYAEGTIRLKSTTGGDYFLYWADDKKALSGYYEITQMSIKKGQTGSFTFDYHTAIPADATKVIAVEASKAKDNVKVKDAVAVYTIPKSKQLGYKSTQALYTFNSYSDIHIDEEHYGETPAYWWLHSEQHWAQALQYSADKNVDFIVSSGDQVTNAKLANLDTEWKAYQNILADSDYVNPIWESGGNHEVRIDGSVDKELAAYVVNSGLDSTKETLTSGKAYYSMTEPKTGDIFIFMALEGGYRPAKYDEFTDEQLDWLEKTISENYAKGKNIYVIQHALISGYGAGDDTENPYYGGSINPDLPSAKRFISIMEQYPDIVWISGHTHEAYQLGYNYSNNDGTSCNMIHNSSIGNPTHLSTTDHALDYTFNEDLSQGYYVQTFENAIIFNGANVCDQKIYPAYSYIINGNTKQVSTGATAEFTWVDTDVTPAMLNSALANVKTMLGIEYRYSSYDQYQTLKKCYYNYKDFNTEKMTASNRKMAYSMISSYIKDLQAIIKVTSK